MTSIIKHDIHSHMLHLFEDFRAFLKGTKENVPFWDIVVLTTADEEQKIAYELQLQDKRMKKGLPESLQFHIFADKPAIKSGNGGATINSLGALYEIYGERVYEMKILMIHAGGKSQRLPSASALGKIFTALPIGEKFTQMLDLKLAIFMPFVKKMSAGVFVTCADDIVPYSLDADDANWSFENEGFTVLAHPSVVELGTKHGVYVLKDVDKLNEDKAVEMVECLRVLQKPGVESMRETNAIVRAPNSDVVYTDSAFFFDRKIARDFVEFYKTKGPVECEIDAYGDFLQALGPNSNRAYIENVSNVTRSHDNLRRTRDALYDLLEGTAINVVLLKNSKFYHIGTMKEYIENFTGNDQFAADIDLNRDNFNAYTGTRTNCSGCIIHSCLTGDSVIAESSVVEFCHFNSPVTVDANTILSNCEVTNNDVNRIHIPGQCFMHTLPVISNNRVHYVTIVLEIGTDLKTKINLNDPSCILYLGRSLFDWREDFGEIFPEGSAGYSSLWEARLFPVRPTMTESFLLALSIWINFRDGRRDELRLEGVPRLSLADVLCGKDVKSMLSYRRELYEKISSLRCENDQIHVA
ncbi:fucose-1-phosphate guanylyltransferase-like [Tubulanus polymorphus]|uniref:fucose-1-phosphate guanylyltransferase-like n=1 Tax=Tubulanus polymorphus TaxID=672921 RepID=UPI003DA2B302